MKRTTILLALGLTATGAVNAAHPDFVEPDVDVVFTKTGEQPGDNFGWVAEDLGDVNDDGIPDVVAGARGGGDKDRGAAYALSGADGSVLYEMTPVGELAEGTQIGTFATFHAAGGGDVDRDGVSDIFIGDFAAFQEEDATGRAYLFSGRTGNRLRVLNAESGGDGLGPGRLIQDVTGDGRSDIYLAAFTWGPNAEGKAYVLSGRGGVLRTMTGTRPFVSLGVDAASLADVNGDAKTDY